MDAAGAREAALCTCLLSYWNSALSANPFNSRPSVFVWADVQGLTYVKCFGGGYVLYVAADYFQSYGK